MIQKGSDGVYEEARLFGGPSLDFGSRSASLIYISFDPFDLFTKLVLTGKAPRHRLSLRTGILSHEVAPNQFSNQAPDVDNEN